MSLSIEQQRASFALEAIERALQRPETAHYAHKEVKSYVRRLPAMIQSNGFGQALAFYYSKRENYAAYGVVYQMIEDWLCQSGQVYATTERSSPPPRLLRAMVSSDQVAYRRAQAETMALLLWLKKFSEALIRSNNPQGG